jgi:glycosyltransferase involved in cell wall biosynthesis
VARDAVAVGAGPGGAQAGTQAPPGALVHGIGGTVKTPFTVLHTIETTGIGGAERVLLNIATGLDRERFRSVAALPAPGLLQDALEAGGVRTYIVHARHWWDFRMPRGLARICRTERVDLVHGHLPDHNFHGCLAARLAGARAIATYHGPLEFRHARAPRDAIKFRLVRSSAAGVVAVCEAVRSLLLGLGFAPASVARIHNGIDLAAYRHAPSAGLRDAFNWRADTPVVGMVANVRATKGYEFFVRAARRAVDRDPSIRFVAAGDIDPVLGPPILALVRELGLTEHVRFLGYRADIPAILRDLDVLVLSSTSEGFPLVLLEAMAAGKAVVATRCGGTEEIVHDGRNGYLVAPADDAALANGISRMFADRVAAAALRDGARRTAEGFSLGGMIDAYHTLYDGVLAGRRAPDGAAAMPALQGHA